MSVTSGALKAKSLNGPGQTPRSKIWFQPTDEPDEIAVLYRNGGPPRASGTPGRYSTPASGQGRFGAPNLS